VKLVLAIVNNDDSHALSQALVKEGFSATRLATTGGFLRVGNTTMIVGVENEKVDQVLDIIGQNCKKRQEMVTTAMAAPFSTGIYGGLPMEITVGGATVFVLDVERFLKV
jgi:uncharacterized protein YaaQ